MRFYSSFSRTCRRARRCRRALARGFAVEIIRDGHFDDFPHFEAMFEGVSLELFRSFGEEIDGFTHLLLARTLAFHERCRRWRRPMRCHTRTLQQGMSARRWCFYAYVLSEFTQITRNCAIKMGFIRSKHDVATLQRSDVAFCWKNNLRRC